jgi:hypothetical protein
MKRVLCLALILAILSLNVSVLARGFLDIEEHWAEKDIIFLAATSIINGMNETEFAPDAQMTRAQFVTMMNRAFPEALHWERDYEGEFGDVKEGHWYYEAVTSAVSAGLVNGMDDGNFGADLPIRRQDACVLLERYIGKRFEVPEVWAAPIPLDMDRVEGYARSSVMIMVSSGIINGYPDGSFHPSRSITRAEVATIIKRALDLIMAEWLRPPTPRPELEEESAEESELEKEEEKDLTAE